MSYTDIPNDLLDTVSEVILWIDNEEGRADAWELTAEIKDGGGNPVDPDTYDFVVRFTAKDMRGMQPLIKWLQYMDAARKAKGEPAVPANPWAQ